MCNEIEYTMIEEYLTKLRQKEKEKESEKPIPVEAVA